MTDGLTRARTARDTGMASAEGRMAAEQDKAVIDQAIYYLADLGDPFSANDVRGLLPVVSGSLIGSRFLTASKRRQIIRIGDTQATHEEGHARRISVWRRASAQPLGHLIAKPEPPEPAEPGVQSALF